MGNARKSPATLSMERRMVEQDVTVIRLQTIAAIVQSWIDWSKEGRTIEGLTTEDGTAIMSLPVPIWPTHGSLAVWVETLNNAATALMGDEG